MFAKNSRASGALISISLLGIGLPVLAHDALEELIAQKTRQIEQAPQNANGYRERGDLYRQNRDWDSALADYSQASALDSHLVEVHRGRAHLFLELGWVKSARRSILQFLSDRPEDPAGHALHAQILERSHEPLAAASEYTRALQGAESPHPDLFLARARALAAAGDAYIGEAIAGLDEGTLRLGGSVVALELLAVDLEVTRAGHDEALRRLDSLAERTSQSASWLARRGDVLSRAGRHSEARAAYGKALAAIEALPPLRRKTRNTVELEAKVRKSLAAIPTDDGEKLRP